jgi:hypothetical protein
VEEKSFLIELDIAAKYKLSFFGILKILLQRENDLNETTQGILATVQAKYAEALNPLLR